MRPESRKWARRLVLAALIATLLVIALAYRFRSSLKEQPAGTSQNLPGNIGQQLSGYTLTRSQQQHQTFTLHASRTLSMKAGGTAVLQTVEVQLFGKDGSRRDLVRAEHAEYNPKSRDFTAEGKVEIELNAQAKPIPNAAVAGPQPVFLETSNVSSQQQGSVLITDDQVKFSVGAISGTAQGMVYDTKSVRLQLNSHVQAELQPTRGASALGRSASLTRLDVRQPEAMSGAGLKTRASRVQTSASPGTQLLADRLLYEKRTGKVTLWGPLEISQGTRRVTAVSGEVSLDAQSRITQICLDGDVRASDILETANSEAAKNGNIGRHPQTSLASTADRVREYFDPRIGQLRKLVAEGGVHVESLRVLGGTGAVDASDNRGKLDAQRLEINFQGMPAKATAGTATGDVILKLESPRTSHAGFRRLPSGQNHMGVGQVKPEIQTLSAPELHFSFRAGGGSLKNAQTRGPGKFVLIPPDPKLGPRTITAGQFLMIFDPRNRLEHVSGLGGTHIVSEPGRAAGRGAVAQESSSETLEAQFSPGTGELNGVDQAGKFHFQSGYQQANAEKAHYSSQTDAAVLTGHPVVWDQATRTRADRIVLHLGTETAEGTGHVQSVRLEKPGPAAETTGSVGHHVDEHASRAGADPQDSGDTINVVADRMVARQQEQSMHFDGHVRAWRGADVVESTSLDYFGKERRLDSGSPVFTTHLTAPAPSASDSRNTSNPVFRTAPPAGLPRPLTVSAQHLEFLDAVHKASYRGKVHLVNNDADLRSDTMDVFFSPPEAGNPSRVDHVVADGHVVITQPGQRATGNHGEYFAGLAKIVLRGGSPTLYDEQKGSTTGQSLTFFIHDDRLLVDGGEKSPTLSKRRIAQ